MQKTANANASEKAKNLLAYLENISGKKIITGQHTQTNPMEEISYIRENTGHTPKLIGFELLSYSPNINYDDATKECIKEVEENKGTLKTALKVAKEKDAILTFSFHWFSPTGGRDKSFYAKNTDFDPTRILTEGTEERNAFYRDMDSIAEELEVFKKEDIPILWRPFHESDGKWFWWGSRGCSVARELYKLMFNYFVNVKKLDNLLWIWNCRFREGYPGDEYVDVISVDIYLDRFKKTDYREEYKKLTAETSTNKVTSLAELGYLPDVAMLSKSNIPWAYFMTWSKEFIMGEKYNSLDSLKSMYSSDYSIKL